MARGRRFLPLAIMAVSLLPALPEAAACSWALPEPYGELHATATGWATRVGATFGHVVGNGTYVPLVGLGPQTFAATTSLDGRWWAFTYGAPFDEPQGGVHGYSSCWMPEGAVEVVDVAGDARYRLADGAAYHLGAGPDGLLVAHARGLFLWRWGTAPELEDLGFAGGRDVRYSSWSADGALVVGTHDGRVAVREGDAWRGVPLDLGSDEWLEGVAFSPEGARLAVLVRDGSDARVRIRDLASDAWVRDVEVEGFPRDLAWGAGLAVSTFRDAEAGKVAVTWLERPDGAAESHPEVEVDGPGGGLAWEGDRLVVAAGGLLRWYGPDVDLERTLDVDADDRPTPRYASPELQSAAPPTARAIPALGAAALAVVALAALVRRRYGS